MIKSPLKWAGGKSWAIPMIQHLRSIYNEGTLWDVFGGSGVISLNVASIGPTSYVDINWDLTNFYRSIQSGALQDVIDNKTVTFVNDKEVYLNNRWLFNEIPRTVTNGTRAALFYYLNRTGFNGLCRYNLRGGFNVPFGKYKTINYRTDFSDIRKVILDNDITIANIDAIKLLLLPAKTGFMYLDPPYMGTFTAYAGIKFGDTEQQQLIDIMFTAKVPVLYHNSATPEVIRLLRMYGIPFEVVDVRRTISANGDRPKAKEVLAYMNMSKVDIEEALHARTAQPGLSQ